jgi:hypothetical protein
MPNWYNGTVTIRGDISSFQKWFEEKKDSDDGFENSFAQTFVPLSSGKWDFGTACREWGTKWDLGNIDIISTEDGEFSFSFDSAWNSPIHLWKQLEDKYNVVVEEVGYEEQQLEFQKYYKGRLICVEVENEWFAEHFAFEPSEVHPSYSELYDDELECHKYDNWCDGLWHWANSVKEDEDGWQEVVVKFDDAESI